MNSIDGKVERIGQLRGMFNVSVFGKLPMSGALPGYSY
jgi:hypothetical protein